MRAVSGAKSLRWWAALAEPVARLRMGRLSERCGARVLSGVALRRLRSRHYVGRIKKQCGEVPSKLPAFLTALSFALLSAGHHCPARQNNRSPSRVTMGVLGKNCLNGLSASSVGGCNGFSDSEKWGVNRLNTGENSADLTETGGFWTRADQGSRACRCKPVDI